MRVIAGKLKGRGFYAPTGHRSHPMSEKMRGAMFNALGDIEGLTVLDGFAGSGALSFEAISRGAQHATAVEVDKTVHQTIAKSIAVLGLETKVKAIRANVGTWSYHNPSAAFDIVLLDPPYDAISAEGLVKLAYHTKAFGVVVLSLPPAASVIMPNDFEALQVNDFGDGQLHFYRKLA